MKIEPKKVTLSAPNLTFEYGTGFDYETIIQDWVDGQIDEVTNERYISRYTISPNVEGAGEYVIQYVPTTNPNYDITVANGIMIVL